MLLQTPNYTSVTPKRLDISQPCIGGVNLYDLEYEQETNQSPDVLNMMYRNGAFGKRYGQVNVYESLNDYHNGIVFDNSLMLHCGTKLLKNNVEVGTLPNVKGYFFIFNRFLYYFCNSKYYVYGDVQGTSVETLSEVTPYIPTVAINVDSGTDATRGMGDLMDNYNRIGKAFKVCFHSSGTDTVFQLLDGMDNLDETGPIVVVDGVTKTQGTDYTFNYTTGTLTFTTAPAEGTNNVEVTAYKTEQEYIDSIMNSKYAISYGGNNNSRIFLAGGGHSTVYYSGVFDATYFPESNYFKIGNTQEDVSGFGEEYDTLIVFKPSEMYSVSYYTDSDGNGQFSTKLVNAKMGCDCPNSIQLINNLLVWCSTTYGVCTLVSTNIEDERNVRVISRNIDGGHRVNGLLEETNLKDCVSIDFESRYMLCVNSRVYVWDYNIAPYTNTGRIESDAKSLAWFIFDNITASNFIIYNKELYYLNAKKVNKFANVYSDFGQPIEAHYMTPLFIMIPDYLKTIRNVYIQVRGDTASIINMKYITEEASENEPEPIIVPARPYTQFSWTTFGWSSYKYASTFRRKCNLKKVQMVGIYFSNSQLDRDMSLSNLTLEYVIVKNIK